MFNIKSYGCYKSQLVAKGFSQIKEINFDELFSLVVHYETALNIGIFIVLIQKLPIFIVI